MLAVMSIHPFVVNFTASSISSALPIYASTPILGLPPKGFSQLTYLVAVNVFMLGMANLWWVPLANTFGRRPVILLSLLLLVFSSMWAGLATSFDSLLAARIFMGIGGAPADAVSPDVVGEIFFVHERGRAMVCDCDRRFFTYQDANSVVCRPSTLPFLPLGLLSALLVVDTLSDPWVSPGYTG